ncbi:MAG: helix-turn-helix domain-containing protein [Prevotella sp.]|nr:helix-turn-helix domain-containing protein [Prevotella sp.]
MICRKCRILFLLLGLLLARTISAADSDKRFYVYNAANGLADNSAQTINCTKTGRLVITTMGQINFYDGQQFTYIDPTTENTYPLEKYNGHAHLYFDTHHHIWLKRRHQLSCVNLTREMFAENIVDEFKALGMENKVLDLFVDAKNIVWLLTEKGLFCAETKKYYQVQPKLNLQELDTYDDKYLLLFYENGQMDALDLASGNTAFSSKAYGEQLVDRYKETCVILRVGNRYYQIRNGSVNGNSVAILLCFDVSTQQWETIMETPYYLSNIVEHNSMLYIPSAYGYWTYDLLSKKMEHIEKLQMSNGQLQLTDINCMEFDRQGGLWVGTEKRGLLYARPFPAPFKSYSWADKRALELSDMMDRQPVPETTFRDMNVNCVLRDSRGWDWVGTSTGLQLYRNSSNPLPQLITRNEGLQNNVIHCIVEDNSHHIWVGTSYGICCLVIEGDRVRYINRYNQWDGVPNESFVNGRSMMLPNGDVVMQALDHVLVFNPQKMRTLDETVKWELYPKLIRLFVNGNDVKAGDVLDGELILDRALARTKELNLRYDQNTLSLTFSGLNYFRPSQTYYRVRRTGPGMSEKWEVFTPYNSQGMVDRSGLLHLPMTSLQPGHYTVEVQVSMLPDEWETIPYEWEININEPWWRTTGALALVFLFLMGLLGIYVLLYLKNANMRARRNSDEQAIIKRIKAFVDRCDARNGAVLEPLPDEAASAELSMMADFSPEFIGAMTAIIPTVVRNDSKKQRLTMRDLSNATHMRLSDFCKVIASNIYKNPRPVAMQMMLTRAADMLKKNGEKDIAEISQECGFVSPNYFIASFYHHYHKTPEQYRQS